MTTMQTPKIGALAPWFGSKRTLARRIISQLGEHRIYWEVFCGSMAVLLNKPPVVMETVNDLHGDLINLARVVRDDDLAPKLFEKMSRTLMHEGIMDECAECYRARGNAPATEEPDLERACDYLLTSWLGRNGVAGTASYNQGFCVRYTGNGGHAATRFNSVIESVPAWWHRLRNVTILNRNARELLAKIDDAKGTTIYLDPPYVEKGAEYIHDFAGAKRKGSSLFCSMAKQPMSHEELAGLARRFTKARVVVSYYDHPKVRELYDGWTFIECPTTKSLVNQGARMKNRGGEAEKAPEVLIVNGPEIKA
jgi:DNA adenine methylase